jgi:hypothetical protein
VVVVVVAAAVVVVVVVVVVRKIMGEEKIGRERRSVTMKKKIVYVPPCQYKLWK